MSGAEVGILVRLPIRTRSPNGGNPGTRWAAIARSREKKEHRQCAYDAVCLALAGRGLEGDDLLPVVVSVTRISAGRLDDDNLAFACKALRDGVADALGVNDGDRSRVRFVYRQRRGERGRHEVEVVIQRNRKENEQ